jgi:hypothetical protein
MYLLRTSKWSHPFGQEIPLTAIFPEYIFVNIIHKDIHKTSATMVIKPRRTKLSSNKNKSLRSTGLYGR